MIQQGNHFLFSFFKVKKMGISAAKKSLYFPASSMMRSARTFLELI